MQLRKEISLLLVRLEEMIRATSNTKVRSICIQRVEATELSKEGSQVYKAHIKAIEANMAAKATDMELVVLKCPNSIIKWLEHK